VLRGVRKPRVCSVPQYSSTAGSEAVDLAKSAGLVLDPWQQDVLTASLGERPDGKWSAFEVGLIVPRQNGKGAILEARELFGLVLAEEELILHSSHLFKTSKDAFRRVLSLFQNTPDLDRKIMRVSNTHGDEGIELVNGCRLVFVARSKGGGRGMSGDCLILDEAYAVTDDQVEALMPTMSARPNGQIWYTSSPPLDSVTGEPLFAMKARGESGDENLAWFDWGVAPDADLDDRRVWAAATPALGIRITEETVIRERKSMKPKGFGRERLGIWPESIGTRVISAELWLELMTPKLARPRDVAFALDVTPLRDHAAIAFAGLDPDGHMLVSVVDHREGTDWVVERLRELKERWDPVAIGLDEKGPGGSLLTDLEKVEITRPADKSKPQRGDLAVPTGQEVGAAFGMFVDAATQKRLRHGDDAPLNLAIAGARTRSLGIDGTAWARKGNTDISPLVAATLANWAFETRAHLVADEYDPQVFFV
jgi:phage terminase large subunit-like protein